MQFPSPRSLFIDSNTGAGRYFSDDVPFASEGNHTSQLLRMCNSVTYVVQAIINFAKTGNHGSLETGKGFAMAIGLFLLTVTASIGQHQVIPTFLSEHV